MIPAVPSGFIFAVAVAAASLDGLSVEHEADKLLDMKFVSTASQLPPPVGVNVNELPWTVTGVAPTEIGPFVTSPTSTEADSLRRSAVALDSAVPGDTPFVADADAVSS